jgi:hypothetical protein
MEIIVRVNHTRLLRPIVTYARKKFCKGVQRGILVLVITTSLVRGSQLSSLCSTILNQYFKLFYASKLRRGLVQWNSYYRRRLRTVDLLIKMVCFVTMGKYSYSLKSTLSKLVRTRRSTVLIVQFQLGFPV